MKIVEHHHHVLPAWAALRARLPKAPHLFTLDRHTDTSAPFRTYLRSHRGESAQELLGRIDFADPDTVAEAVAKLAHDEHIVAAISTNIVSCALVVAQNAMDTDQATFNTHQIACREIRRTELDQVLESRVLDRAIEALHGISGVDLWSEPFILDIDLDYFQTFAAIAPGDASTIRALAQRAELITIATEPEFVRTGALDSGLSADFLLEELLSLIA